MNQPILLDRLTCTSPTEFEEGVYAVAGETKASPINRYSFRCGLRATRLSKVGFLNMDFSPAHVEIPEAHDFLGLTVPLNTPISIARDKKFYTYDRDTAHLLHPGEPFNFRIAAHGSVLGTNFNFEELEKHSQHLLGSSSCLRPGGDVQLSLATSMGSGVLRYLFFIWGELSRGGGILRSPLVASELEDGLITALLLSIEGEDVAGGRDHTVSADRRIARAEEYLMANLCAPVSRDKLAEVANASIRTLSRGFMKRHGVGPMAFLRQRRLEAARVDLLAAEPGGISVSEVAMRYGFADPSSFSSAYKAAFHELPSETLLS